MKNNKMIVHNQHAEPWSVTLIDTGDHTMTGGRIKRIKQFVANDDFFCLTYGDGVGNINIQELIKFHTLHGKLATLTATYPPGRFGSIEVGSSNQIVSFKEKPKGDGGMINGGFFVLSPKVIDLIEDDSAVWEQEPLEKLVTNGEIYAFPHHSYWQPMDTLRDKNILEELWSSNKAPWKVWT